MLSSWVKEILEVIAVAWILFLSALWAISLSIIVKYYLSPFTNVKYEESLESRVEYMEQFVLPEATLQGTNSYQTYQTPSPPAPKPPIYEDEN